MTPGELRTFHRPVTVAEPCGHSDHTEFRAYEFRACDEQKVTVCAACDEVWPCEIATMLATLERCEEDHARDLARLGQVAALVAEYQHTPHVPGARDLATAIEQVLSAPPPAVPPDFEATSVTPASLLQRAAIAVRAGAPIPGGYLAVLLDASAAHWAARDPSEHAAFYQLPLAALAESIILTDERRRRPPSPA